MQGRADFHDCISDPRLQEAADVVDNAAALDAAVDMLDVGAPTGNPTIRGFLFARESLAPRRLRRHDDLDVVEAERQEAEFLEQAASGPQGVGGHFGNPFIVGTACIGFTVID
jgi:hypothetical protein